MIDSISLIKNFCKFTFVERDLEKALSCLSKNIFWYGTSDHEDVKNIDEAREYIILEMKNVPFPYKFTFIEENELLIYKDCSTVFMRAICEIDCVAKYL